MNNGNGIPSDQFGSNGQGQGASQYYGNGSKGMSGQNGRGSMDNGNGAANFTKDMGSSTTNINLKYIRGPGPMNTVSELD